MCMVRTAVTHSCSYNILTSFVIYYSTNSRKHEMYLLNSLTSELYVVLINI